MNQVQIDVEQGWFASRFSDDVGVPDVLKKCIFICHILSLCFEVRGSRARVEFLDRDWRCCEKN